MEVAHDRQSQFEGTLAEWHRMFSNASDEPIHRPGETIVFQKVAGSTFEVSASDSSAGIQIADLALWLFRQYLAGRSMPVGSANILNYVFRKGYQQDFSFKGVAAHLERLFADVMAKDIPIEALAEGRKLLAEQEKRRVELMQLYEIDGLMPYEREPMKVIPPSGE